MIYLRYCLPLGLCIHLISQWYESKERGPEFKMALLHNLANPYIGHIHLLQSSHPLVPDHPKLSIHQMDLVNSTLTVREAVMFASTFLTDQLVVLTNLDIYFDPSIRFLHEITLESAYFLSRHEFNSTSGTGCDPARYIVSHDAFAFLPPLPKKLAERLGFCLGTPGMEARMIWEFRRHGIQVSNPCKTIKVWHIHRNASGVYPFEAVNTRGRSDSAWPEE
jgi:hypothetical protein